MSLPLNIQLFAEQDNGGNTNPNGGDNNTGGEGGANTGTTTYTQEQLDAIVNERTGRATKSALSSFFKQKGLSEEEANNAIATYLENKKQNTPDVAKLQDAIVTANKDKTKAEIELKAVLLAVEQGIAVDTIPYLLKLADFKEVVIDGKINADKLNESIKKVLEDVPALKGTQQSNGSNNGFQQIGGSGNNQNVNTNTAKNNVPTKKWNKFNN